MKISATIPTRGDVDLTTILNSLPFDDVIVWDNSERQNLKCYGRFKAAEEARHDWIFTQDDDLLAPIPGFLRACKHPRKHVVVGNKPPDEAWRFLGLGALFHRDLLASLDRYLDAYGMSDDFLRAADVAFAYQHPYQAVWVGAVAFPYHRAPNRMYHQPDHMAVRERVRANALALRRPVD